jgi:excisionase family DNA binding protein
METQLEQWRDQFVGTQELMNTLSISRSTVNRLVKRGMPHIWIGSARRFPLREVIEWLKSDQQKQ